MYSILMHFNANKQVLLGHFIDNIKKIGYAIMLSSD